MKGAPPVQWQHSRADALYEVSVPITTSSNNSKSVLVGKGTLRHGTSLPVAASLLSMATCTSPVASLQVRGAASWHLHASAGSRREWRCTVQVLLL